MKTTYRKLGQSVSLIAAAFLGVAVALATGIATAQTPTPAAESPSLLLERGLYNEQTKGDLNAAMAIYRQVITQARANDSLAAQAEFHLGQCQLKKGDTQAATETLQKLITDYPNESALIAKAKAITEPATKLLPAPWADGERLLLRISTANGTDLGMTEYRSDLITSGTRQLWQVGARTTAAAASSLSAVEVDPVTMVPVSSHFQHSSLGTVDATYSPGQVDLHSPGKDPIIVHVTGEVYDNEEAVNGIRRLPLAPGYKLTFPVFSTFGGSQIPVGLEVKGIEKLTVPAGTFDCYKVVLSLGQTFWFSTDANRYLVQFDAGLINAKLYSIAKRGIDAPVTFSDSDLGVSFTAPPQWVPIRLVAGQPAGQSLIRTYDPNGDTTDGGIRYFDTSTLTADEQKSSQAWADSEFKTLNTALGSDVKIHPEGWKPYTIDGLSGAGAVIDSTVGKTRMTTFLLCVHAPKNSELFVLACPADKFDALFAQFQTIVASYKRQ